eukprot:1508139-Ditylum_brightwellii.AAC.1
MSHENSAKPSKSFENLMEGVVLVGLWAGTDFIADRTKGLVITASHALMEMKSGHQNSGRNYFGLKSGKAVVGIIPRSPPPSGDGCRSSKA